MNPNVDVFDLPMLRAFRALVEESSVTRAANVLGISQPAMSGQLKRLREVFHDPILTRVAGGSKPTARARELLGPVSGVLSRIDLLASAREDYVAPEDYRLTVNIAATDYTQQMLLKRALQQIRDKAPGVRLDFRRADRTRVHEWMEQGSVDLGIGPMTVPSGSLHSRRLYRDQACCIVGKAVLGSEALTLDRYCQLAHLQVVPARESYFDEAVTTKLASLGRDRNVVLTVPDFLGVTDIVKNAPIAATVATTLLRSGDVAEGLDVHPLPFSLPDMQVGLYWHDRTHGSAVHKWLRAMIIETFRRSTQ